MQLILLLQIITILFCNSCFSQGNNIILGKFRYAINYVTQSEKAGDGTLINNTFVVFRQANRKKDLFSYLSLAKRDDSLFANGTYSFNEETKKLTTKNYFFNLSYYKIDSSYTYFLQLKNGSFYLKQHSEFVNGKEKKILY